MTVFRPMLAATAPKDLTQLHYPLYVSPKLDGVRALVRDGVVVSRNLKPIPSQTVQERYGLAKYEGLDGELICGDPRSPTCFRDTTSAVMSYGRLPAETSVSFNVFDWLKDPERGFSVRFHALEKRFGRDARLRIVQHTLATTPEELVAYEEIAVGQGYEGIMLRDPVGPYKYGRSTLREGWLIKLKRFLDSEAEVVAVVELQRNANAATRDALGYARRSSHKAGRVAGQTMGALRVRDCTTGVIFEIGTGFTSRDRAQFWDDRLSLVGQICTYRYFPTGSKEKPRFPVFAGWRHPLDTPA